jgi:hypothetical protein
MDHNFDHNWVWAAIPITAILAGVLTTWIRARHGYPLDRRGRRGGGPRGAEPRAFLDGRRGYDGSSTPEPPAALATSLFFGKESTIRSTASW